MASSDHLAGLKASEEHEKGAEVGCLWRSCGRKGHIYRKNGLDYLEGNKKLFGRYYNKDFSLSGSVNSTHFSNVMTLRLYKSEKQDPRVTKKAWHIGEGQNFTTGKHPWKNNAHHILPCGTLKNAFNGEEFEILLKGKYNINIGENVIYLPKEKKVGEALKMYTHPGSHPKYNDSIHTLIEQKLKPKIKKATDPDSDGCGPLTEKEVGNVRKMINDETVRIMKDILKGGKNSDGVPINKYAPSWMKK